MGKKNIKKRKKIRFQGLLIVVLFFYLIFSCLYYLWMKPIKKIEIEGNIYLKDNYIKDYLDINNVSLLKLNKKEIKNKLLDIDLINQVKINKNYFGKVTIKVEEDKILFYNWNNKKIILSSGKEIDYNKNYLGFATLINYVPNDIYKDLVNKLNGIDTDILSLVSEIEYSPSYVGEKTVDENRFLFRMNDGNAVYINTINIEKLNDYLEIYEAIVSKNGKITGCLYLDSNSGNNHFNSCENMEVVEDVGEGEQN